ncbi:glutamate 5-kinase [Mangrovicoccus algicola]|uniref:Glutamate 5-kinase n=1 Tax=Mangrovicoccus algicola TaxID=2771008 RepID=A0A8J6YSV0_9RHOB|nr:glutamate 5-kinase [Mangrovicoccus algicola]MBE3637157.1 glutamate 5-kinase [Mangrovicoccus algicola]
MASLTRARRLVVKIGSALLVDRASGLRRDWLETLAADVAWLRGQGAELVLVSSGSIALGRRVLGLPDGALPLEQAQAAAAVGQVQLARAYEEVLSAHGLHSGQVLVTLADSEDRRRYLNSRATLNQLLTLGVVPVVNENDTVATDEIRYGDNDRLAAQVAVVAGADQLVLLSDVDGLYTANPQVDPSARRFDLVEELTPEIEAMAGEGVSGLSKGGMITKLMAARTAMAAGCDMAITLGARPNPLRALAEGAASTWFRAQTDPATARKAWILAMKPRGEVIVDDGARQALGRGKSLLPAGVTEVAGAFGRGEPVTIRGRDGTRIGIGLSRYTSAEIGAIAGRQSRDIAEILGYSGRAALIHRDDMVL